MNVVVKAESFQSVHRNSRKKKKELSSIGSVRIR